MSAQAAVAYCTMGIGLESRIPNSAGGLGVLAGDPVRAVADQKTPFVLQNNASKAATTLSKAASQRACLPVSGSCRGKVVDINNLILYL